MPLVRVATKTDRPSIADVVRAAFGQNEEVELVERIWAAPEYLPDLELVAEKDGVIVGHVLHSTGYVVDRKAVALAPLAVLPTHQRGGIGGALMREGIARANAAGHPVIVLLGHTEYYPKFGFVPARSLGITPSIELPTDPDPFMALPLDAYDESIKGEFRYCWE